MLEKDIVISNKLGLHARAAAKFVTLASSFSSNIEIARGNHKVNGKSIMGVMMLAAAKGTRITLLVSGNDENEAADRLEELVTKGFGEEE